MFDAEEIEGQLQRTIDAINRFNEAQDKYEEARNADYQLSMMRLMLGSKFDNLHWFASAEREVISYLDKKTGKDLYDQAKSEIIKEVEEYAQNRQWN